MKIELCVAADNDVATLTSTNVNAQKMLDRNDFNFGNYSMRNFLCLSYSPRWHAMV